VDNSTVARYAALSARFQHTARASRGPGSSARFVGSASSIEA
jgi:hypothetical protein